MPPITDLKFAMFSTPAALAAFVTGGGGNALVQSGDNVFPMELEGETLVIKVSSDGGSTYPVTKTHTFGAGSGEDHTGDDPAGPDQTGFFMSLDEVIEDIQDDDTFMSGLLVYKYGTAQIVIKTSTVGNKALKVDATSTGIGVDLLQFLSDQIGNGSVSSVVSVIADSNGQFLIFYT